MFRKDARTYQYALGSLLIDRSMLYYKWKCNFIAPNLHRTFDFYVGVSSTWEDVDVNTMYRIPKGDMNDNDFATDENKLAMIFTSRSRMYSDKYKTTLSNYESLMGVTGEVDFGGGNWKNGDGFSILLEFSQDDLSASVSFYKTVADNREELVVKVTGLDGTASYRFGVVSLFGDHGVSIV